MNDEVHCNRHPIDGNGTLDLLVHSSDSRLGIFNEGGWTLNALEQTS